MKIKLVDKLSSYQIYKTVLKQLSLYYSSEDRREVPIISFEDVNYIAPSAMPILMCMINIIYKYHDKTKIKIHCNYQPRLFYFLYHSNFVFYAKERLKFIDINDENIGGFGEYIDHAYIDRHKLHVYSPIANYYELSAVEQVRERGKIYEHLAYHIVPRDYGEVLRGTNMLGEKHVNECIMLISEIIANAQVYSKSLCYSYMMSNKFSTIIAVADIGVGLNESIRKKRENNLYTEEMYDRFYFQKNKIINQFKEIKLDDYMNIMEALYYSENQNRINLWYLKNMIVNNNGVLRIHTNSTQVIFTYNKCSNCKKSCLECLSCMLKDVGTPYEAVRIFESRLVGVHIEIEIKR